MVPLPEPDVGETVTFGWFEEAVQFVTELPLKLTVTNWGSVTVPPPVPKFRDAALSDMEVEPAGGVMVVGSEAAAVTEPPPDTLAWFVTCDGAFDATLTVAVMAG